MSELDEAQNDLRAVQQRVISAARDELRAALDAAFSNEEVETVAWGQKVSEYNDEGMYPGIAGPVINVLDPQDPRADSWGWLGDRYTPSEDFEDESAAVKATLDRIGEETLVQIAGDDEHIVYAVRAPDGFRLYSEYAGY